MNACLVWPFTMWPFVRWSSVWDSIKPCFRTASELTLYLDFASPYSIIIDSSLHSHFTVLEHKCSSNDNFQHYTVTYDTHNCNN